MSRQIDIRELPTEGPFNLQDFSFTGVTKEVTEGIPLVCIRLTRQISWTHDRFPYNIEIVPFDSVWGSWQQTAMETLCGLCPSLQVHYLPIKVFVGCTNASIAVSLWFKRKDK